MKSLYAIVVGDATDHGGTVVTGSSRFSIYGLPAALVGSRVFCPLHGVTTIVPGDGTAAGCERIAISSDTTSCGAKLVSALQVRSEPGRGSGRMRGTHSNTEDTLLKEVCDGLLLRLENNGRPLSDIPYQIIRNDGRVELGVTSAEGLSHCIDCSYDKHEAIWLEVLQPR